MAAPKYVSVHITREARAAVQRLQLLLSADAGRRLTVADVLLAAAVTTERHRPEALEVLDAQPPHNSTPEV